MNFLFTTVHGQWTHNTCQWRSYSAIPGWLLLLLHAPQGKTRRYVYTGITSSVHSVPMGCAFSNVICTCSTESSTAAVKEMLDSSFYVINRDFDSFSKKWFETEIKFPSSLVGDSSYGSDSPSPPHSLASSLKAGHSYYMGFEHTEETYSKERWSGWSMYIW